MKVDWWDEVVFDHLNEKTTNRFRIFPNSPNRGRTLDYCPCLMMTTTVRRTTKRKKTKKRRRLKTMRRKRRKMKIGCSKTWERFLRSRTSDAQSWGSRFSSGPRDQRLRGIGPKLSNCRSDCHQWRHRCQFCPWRHRRLAPGTKSPGNCPCRQSSPIRKTQRPLPLHSRRLHWTLGSANSGSQQLRLLGLRQRCRQWCHCKARIGQSAHTRFSVDFPHCCCLDH